MSNPVYELQKLSDAAKADEELRMKLLATRKAKDPTDEFCIIAQKYGFEIYLGDLFAIGQEYSDNQCKSTNGGNPSPYFSFEDTYDNFLCGIEK